MKKLILLCALMASVVAVKAEESFFQASLTPEIAFKAKTERINGICLSIWGENPQSAFALGFVNGSSGDSKGLSLGIVNYSETYTGLAVGFVNYSKVDFTGLQAGVLLNVAKGYHGLQLGFFNYAENLHGVQLGLVNVAKNNSWFKDFPNQLATGFPFFNWSF